MKRIVTHEYTLLDPPSVDSKSTNDKSESRYTADGESQSRRQNSASGVLQP